MGSRVSATNGNLLKWPYENRPGDHDHTVESIKSSCVAKEMPDLFHNNQHISHLETASGKLLQTPGRHQPSFLRKLYSKEYNSKGKDGDVQTEIQTLLINTLKLLQEKYLVMRNSSLRLAGSMGEHTKIGKPDEFDFVIILPQLSEIDIFWPDRMSKNKHLRKYVKDFKFGYKNASSNHIRYYIHELLLAALVENLTDHWKIVLTGCNFYIRKTAATFHLIRSLNFIKVDIDVTILIPFKKKILERYACDLKIEQTYIDNLADKDGIVFAIFRYDNHAFRPSKAHLETAFLKKESRQRVYIVAKLIVKIFLPKMEVREHCVRCVESIVSSYTLKNILLYMMDFYPHDSYWTDNMSTRVIEVFVILKHCYDQIDYNFVEYVSMKPTHLENKLKYSPCLKRLFPKKATVTGDIRKDDESIIREIERSTLWELSEIYFQMINAKQVRPIGKICKKSINDKVWFSDGSFDDEDVDFDPSKSTPGKRRTNPKEEPKIRHDDTPPLSCFLPSMESRKLIRNIIEDECFKKEVDDYFNFLQTEHWDFREVITRLVQLLLPEQLPLDVKQPSTNQSSNEELPLDVKQSSTNQSSIWNMWERKSCSIS